MEEAEVQQMLQKFGKYRPQKLFKIWWKQNIKRWTPDEYEVMRLALIDKRELLLPPEPERGVTARCVFRKKRIKPLIRYGAYRGHGVMYADETGIALTGKHVFSIAKRWGIALAVFAGCSVLTMGTLAPGIIPLYWLVEYGILKKQNLWVPYSQVCKYAANPRKGMISIEFNGPKYCSPAVFNSDDWPRILWMLRYYAPRCDATPHVQI